MDKHNNLNSALCHMREVLDLKSALNVAKARLDDEPAQDVSRLEATLEREMADLLLLLQTLVPDSVVESRRLKFPEGVLG